MGLRHGRRHKNGRNENKCRHDPKTIWPHDWNSICLGANAGSPAWFQGATPFQASLGRLTGLPCVSGAHHPVRPHAGARSSVAAVCYVGAHDIKRGALTAGNITRSFRVAIPNQIVVRHERRELAYRPGRGLVARESLWAFYRNHTFALAHLPASWPAGPWAGGRRQGDPCEGAKARGPRRARFGGRPAARSSRDYLSKNRPNRVARKNPAGRRARDWAYENSIHQQHLPHAPRLASWGSNVG